MAVLACLLAACPGGDAPVFPKDYETSYAMLRPCHQSADHDLQYVTVWANGISLPPYDAGPYPMPAGSILVKPQYLDPGCTQLAGWTAMARPADGGAWVWQKLDPKRNVLTVAPADRCVSCHQSLCPQRDDLCD